jgi:hypothetical protein
MLPGAFYGIEDQRKQANSYATLREINALMLGEAGFHSGYPNGRRIETLLPPFKDVAVYDGVNEHGRTWRSTDEIVALMAETLWLLTSSEVGSQEINLKINEAGVLTDVSPGGYATCATTSGAVVLRFPARTAAVWCALRHAGQMIAGADGRARRRRRRRRSVHSRPARPGRAARPLSQQRGGRAPSSAAARAGRAAGTAGRGSAGPDAQSLREFHAAATLRRHLRSDEAAHGGAER